MKYSVLLPLLLLVSTCAAREGPTTSLALRWESTAMVLPQGLEGGVMFYGIRRGGGAQIVWALDREEEVTLGLPNGLWDFYAVGHRGPGPLEGAPRCALSLGQSLQGPDQTLVMSPKEASCGDSFFGPRSTKVGGNPKELRPMGCSNKTYFEGKTPSCYPSLDNSYTLSLGAGGRAGELTSRCLKKDGPHLQIPAILSPHLSPPLTVTLYADENCRELVGATHITNLHGNRAQKGLLNFDPQGPANALFLYAPVCGHPKGQAPSPFSQAPGEYILCNGQQFKDFVPSHLNASYTLGQDIDLGGASLSGPLVPGAFSGLLSGAGYKIHRFSLKAQGPGPVGLLEEVAQGGRIEGVILEDVTLSCLEGHTAGLGALAGRLAGGGRIEGAQLSQIRLETSSCERAGGLLGLVGTGSTLALLRDTRASHIQVSLDGLSHRIGGVVGSLEAQGLIHGAYLEEVTFRDEAPTSLGPSSSFGGMLGSMAGPNNEIRDILASRIRMGTPETALTQKHRVGLIVGQAGSDSEAAGTLHSLKAKEGILYGESQGQAHGGVVGYLNSGTLSQAIADTVNLDSKAQGVGGILGELKSDHDEAHLKTIRSRGRLDCTSSCGGVVGRLEETANDLSLSEAYSDISFSSQGSSTGPITGTALGGSVTETFYRSQGGEAPDFHKTLSSVGGLFRLGTGADPILLSTQIQWNAVGDEALLMDRSFRLARDLDFQGLSFVPFGSRSRPFQGELLGNHKTITNISLRETDMDEPLGLIRVMAADPGKSPLVANLSLEGITFSSNDSPTGALAGLVRDHSDGATTNPVWITSVVVRDSFLELDSTETQDCLGGLMGQISLQASSSLLEGLYAENLSLSDRGGSHCVGGLMGEVLDGANTEDAELSLRGLLVRDLSLEAPSARYVGGLVGRSQHSHVHYENLLVEKSTLGGYQDVGGLFGRMAGGQISLASSLGVQVTAGGEAVGGLVGSLDEGASISGALVRGAPVSGADSVGCLVGFSGNTANTVENSLAHCLSVTANPDKESSAFGLGDYATPSVGNLYTGPVDRNLGNGLAVWAQNHQILDPDWILRHSDIKPEDPWLFEKGQVPTTIFLKYPLYSFPP